MSLRRKGIVPLVALEGLALILTIGASMGIARGAENWPQFRGPQSSGVAEGTGLPEAWSAKENVLWKLKIPGRGWSSPIVWGDRVFVTAAIQEVGESEPVKKGFYFGGDRPAAGALQRWMVYCIDWATGKTVWERTAGRRAPRYGRHLKNSFASETPVTDGQRVYAYFGSLGLFCYDFDGKELWSRSWGEFPMRANWGTAASPVLHGDRVYVVNDNQEKSFLVAVDKVTGKDVWRVDRDEKSNWSTPFVWERPERTEIVTAGTRRVRSYGLDGKLLWELGGMSSITIPTPFAGKELLYLGSGFIVDRKRPVFAIRPGASGDISLKDAETSNSHVAWCQKLAGPYNPSPLLYGDHLYVLYDLGQCRGTVPCHAGDRAAKPDPPHGKPVAADRKPSRIDEQIGIASV